MRNFAEDTIKSLTVLEKAIVFLYGDLGAGKTSLTQLMLQALGWCGRVKSPTYSLIEPYEIIGKKVYHLDLYRLQDDEELYHLGIQDLLQEDAFIFVEWPERLQALEVKPTLEIFLEMDSTKPSARYVRIFS